jgi:hypothetical protein
MRRAARCRKEKGIAGDIVRQEFQGCEAMKLCVFGLVDDTHPPPPIFSMMIPLATGRSPQPVRFGTGKNSQSLD